MKSRRKILFIAAGVVLASSWLFAAAASAQEGRYIGRATGAIKKNTDGTTSTTADSCAGTAGNADGTTKPCVLDKTCDMSAACCFNEPNEPEGCDQTPCDQSNAGVASCTVGGAQDSAHTARPGFPRVLSFARGATVPLGPVLIIHGDAVAIADSFDGTLDATSGPSLVFLSGTQIGEIGEGQTQNFGLFSVESGKTTRSVKDGLSTISIDAAICRASSGFEIFCGGTSEAILGHAEAGVEIPFTSGGGGCSLGRDRRGRGGAMLAGTIFLLWLVARRRRPRR